MENEIKTRPKIKKEYYVRCLKCGKEITGTSNDHVLANFRIHHNLKHKGELNGEESPDASLEGE